RYENDRNIFVKTGHSIKNVSKAAIGPKHMGVKLIIAGVLALVAFVSFFKMTYHVRSSFVLQPVEKRSICPPYDGSIEIVFHKPGDRVSKGQVLARMRTIDLTMELNQAQKEAWAKAAEADKAEADNKLGDKRAAL